MELKRKTALVLDIKNILKKAVGNLVACCFFALIFFSGCATVIAPTGGEPDEIPPKMDTLKSTPNYQTNFEKQRIELKFNEWIKLNDVFNQVVVSPPLAQKDYEVSLKGKTVRFDFSEEVALRENATYTISFGEAIQDLTKGNKAEDIRFVFSTGDVIDSLEVTGKIVDAFSGEPVEGALFMLYDNLADSVVKTEFPLYFGQTGENGFFKIQNVRAGSFKGFALKEEVGKYKYDQPTEQIGFPDELVVVSDSTRTNLEISLFQEIPPFKLKEDNVADFGKVSLLFNKEPKGLGLTYDEIGQKVYQKTEGDSIRFWYNLDTVRTWKIYLQKDSTLTDTIKVRTKSKADFLEKNPFQIVGSKAASVQGSNKGRGQGRGRDKSKTAKKTKIKSLSTIALNPSKPLVLKFTHPIDLIDLKKIKLLEDTTRIKVNPTILRDTADFQNLIIDFKWKEAISYELHLDSSAITGWFGTQNDSIIQPVKILERKDFGNILLEITEMDSTKGYVFEVLGKNEKLEKEFTATDSEKFKTELKLFSPGDYSVRIIEDLNKNGRWDPGDYESKKSPEKVFLKKIETLRANWDVEVAVSLNSFLEKVPEEEQNDEDLEEKE